MDSTATRENGGKNENINGEAITEGLERKTEQMKNRKQEAEK